MLKAHVIKKTGSDQYVLFLGRPWTGYRFADLKTAHAYTENWNARAAMERAQQRWPDMPPCEVVEVKRNTTRLANFKGKAPKKVKAETNGNGVTLAVNLSGKSMGKLLSAAGECIELIEALEKDGVKIAVEYRA